MTNMDTSYIVVAIASYSRSFSDSYPHFVDFFAINCSKPNLFHLTMCRGCRMNHITYFLVRSHILYVHQSFEIHSHLHVCMCIRMQLIAV